jgi:long-chain-fatty-acid--[acyl-carrier-protein] ligase
VGEAFVRRALAQPNDVAVADRMSGVLTYRRLLVGAKLLSQPLGQLPSHEARPQPRGPVSPRPDASLGETRRREAVGVMLPASVAADVVYFALLLAGKLPVMMNWTTGPGNLAHAVQRMNIRHVVTSRRLIDRLGITVDGAELVFLEELRGRIGKFRALWTLLASYLGGRRWLRQLPPADPDAPAVVLFTSGSESAPKAVPLSHRNVLHNVHAAIDVLGLTCDDALLGFLPPFHSFGLTGGMLMPILLGVRVVHQPDPTDARRLVELTARYRATHLITTPTFLSYLLGRATPDDLQSLRVVVTGAEKCPEAVFARCAEVAPQVTILEGYGITECAPVVAGNRIGRSKPGTVGPPLDGVEVCVVDPETHAPLPVHATGMLLVHGPTVFPGYWNHDGPQPFTERDGKRWYVTGDLVALDDEGFIHFRGRLKRFLKVAGEMVSLPALEEPFLRRYPPTDRGPQVAVEGIETPDGRWIVLFSVVEIALREANALLAEAGFRGVMRLDEVARLESIPVLGTGKTDYKVLQKLIVQRQATTP